MQFNDFNIGYNEVKRLQLFLKNHKRVENTDEIYTKKYICT